MFDKLSFTKHERSIFFSIGYNRQVCETLKVKNGNDIFKINLNISKLLERKQFGNNKTEKSVIAMLTDDHRYQND